ncbi:hypothetical protein [Actinokineospora terrae]|uniref:Uncharacterized protein n=1 Tax=Actinokineospora terrae TaxID=155974 RepID=A0A1H9X7B4_9PSEU|nr:hypothetical protein [Actinokineospora terrae]SES42025.1 hypothetical protein SAMN04487818_11391 [Actinokineospora terrae]
MEWAPGDTADKKIHWLLYGCHEFEHVSSAVWVTPPTSTTRYLGRFGFGPFCEGFIEHTAYYPRPKS